MTDPDPNPYRVPGFYDETPKQSPLERIILEQFKKLNWEMDDDISIEIAGSQIYEIEGDGCLLYTSPSPRDISGSRMPSSA